MSGGISLFLLFLIIVVGAVLFFMLGGLGAVTEGLNERRARREGRPRPEHTTVEDDGTASGRRGDRPAR